MTSLIERTRVSLRNLPPGQPGPAELAGATIVAILVHARSVHSSEREAFADALGTLEPDEGAIVIHTCHRVELYLVPSKWGERPLPEVPAGGVILRDVEAVRHLISVACGSDSTVFGEDQVLHQLRETLAERHASSPLDPILDRLFQIALHAGRQAHTWFGSSPRSLADVALDRIAPSEVSLEGRTILVVGAGQMGRLAAHAASRRGAQVIVTNRSSEPATAVAHEIGASVVPFGVDDVLGPTDGIVVALSGPWPIGRRDATTLAGTGPVVVDLSSPPAVPVDVREALGDRFVSVDDLAEAPDEDGHDRLRRRVEKLVSDTGRDYCAWLRARDSVPAIAAMAAAAEGRRHSEMAWLLRRLPDLNAEEQAVVEQMSHRLVAAILHGPMSALKSDPDGDLERAARELFRL